MKRKALIVGALLGVLIVSCGQEADSKLNNSSSPVLAETVACEQGVVALGTTDKKSEVSAHCESHIEKDTQFLVPAGELGETFQAAARAQPRVCVEGRRRNVSCVGGWIGYRIQECLGNAWHIVQDLCVKPSDPRDPPDEF